MNEDDKANPYADSEDADYYEDDSVETDDDLGEDCETEDEDDSFSEEEALEVLFGSEEDEPCDEKNTKLTNFITYQGVLFVIDSCYIGDNEGREPDDKDWETAVAFCNPEGYFTCPLGLEFQYDTQLEMIQQHLQFVLHPETIFETECLPFDGLDDMT